MKPFWHDLITERSWIILQQLKQEFNFVLIGGWAVYVYTQSLKSKDIDIIIQYEDLAKLQNHYPVSKNERLHMYEIKKEEIEVDIYLPFYSKIGIPIVDIQSHTINQHGFIVPALPVLVLLKLFAYTQRQHSLKGDKDKIDILSLLMVEPTCVSQVQQLAEQYHLSDLKAVLTMIIQRTIAVPELQLNRHQYAKLKQQLLKT